MRIAIIAPACPIDEDVASRVKELAARDFMGVELVFHRQCFLEHGHFAGDDAVREEAFVRVANDPSFDAVWFARGGYGSCRFATRAIARLASAAGDKVYLGYSDTGVLLAGLYKQGVGKPVHGPMPADIRRKDGEAAVARSLGWLADGDRGGNEAPQAAFNLTVLSHLLGTPLEPDLTGHVLSLEDVDEHHYRIDRALFHVTSSPAIGRVKGIRQGRFAVAENNRPFFPEPGGQDVDAIFRHWCTASGIAYLGRADIGHDAANAIVPFGPGAAK